MASLPGLSRPGPVVLPITPGARRAKGHQAEGRAGRRRTLDSCDRSGRPWTTRSSVAPFSPTSTRGGPESPLPAMRAPTSCGQRSSMGAPARLSARSAVRNNSPSYRGCSVIGSERSRARHAATRRSRGSPWCRKSSRSISWRCAGHVDGTISCNPTCWARRRRADPAASNRDHRPAPRANSRTKSRR